jgi:hypothetical protein
MLSSPLAAQRLAGLCAKAGEAGEKEYVPVEGRAKVINA